MIMVMVSSFLRFYMKHSLFTHASISNSNVEPVTGQEVRRKKFILHISMPADHYGLLMLECSGSQLFLLLHPWKELAFLLHSPKIYTLFEENNK